MPNFSDSLDLPRLRQPKPGTFGRERPPSGRALGNVNRITKDLKAGIVDAAAAHGSDGNGAGGLTGYLYFLAGSHPKVFSNLLAKLLPYQLHANVGATSIGAINVMPIANGSFVSAADIAKLVAPLTIESKAADDQNPAEIENNPVEDEPGVEPETMRLVRTTTRR